jgi:hypothetical protein
LYHGDTNNQFDSQHGFAKNLPYREAGKRVRKLKHRKTVCSDFAIRFFPEQVWRGGTW